MYSVAIRSGNWPDGPPRTSNGGAKGDLLRGAALGRKWPISAIVVGPQGQAVLIEQKNGALEESLDGLVKHCA